MVRIEGKDADAIGEDLEAPVAPQDTGGKSIEQLCWDQLKSCYDPEIPVNIVDLGLVYSCEVQKLAESEHKVSVRFTLTAPGCGMGDYLRDDIESKIRSIEGVEETDVQIAFEPAWNQSMMSEAARLQLGLM
jgi:probable FeS assembly SUF system protein SufT